MTREQTRTRMRTKVRTVAYKKLMSLVWFSMTSRWARTTTKSSSRDEFNMAKRRVRLFLKRHNSIVSRTSGADDIDFRPNRSSTTAADREVRAGGQAVVLVVVIVIGDGVDVGDESSSSLFVRRPFANDNISGDWKERRHGYQKT